MDSWSTVQQLGLVTENIKGKILFYGTSDPLPNPGELLLTQMLASNLDVSWKFFVYRHGKNISMEVPEDCAYPPNVITLEEIIPGSLNLRTIAQEVFRLRREAVVIAHLDKKAIRATTSSLKDIPDITIEELHCRGGWLGGSGIHYCLRLYAEITSQVVYLCPYQEKGRVYEIYKEVKREDKDLFVLAPFVRIQPPPSMAPNGWEPMTWKMWRALPAKVRRLARLKIKREIKQFFRRGEPRRIEIPWRWWI